MRCLASALDAKCRFEHGFKLPSPYSRKWPLEVTLARIPAVLYIPVMSKCVACSSSTANFCPKTGPKTKKWCAACCKKNEVPGTFHNPSRKRKAAAGGKAAGGKAAAAARGGGRKKRPRSASWDLDESLNEHNERRDSTDSTSADGLFGGYRSSRQDADDEDDEQDDEHDEDDEQDVCEDCDSQPAVSALPAEMEPRWCEGCAGAHDGATTEYGDGAPPALASYEAALAECKAAEGSAVPRAHTQYSQKVEDDEVQHRRVKGLQPGNDTDEFLVQVCRVCVCVCETFSLQARTHDPKHKHVHVSQTRVCVCVYVCVCVCVCAVGCMRVSPVRLWRAQISVEPQQER